MRRMCQGNSIRGRPRIHRQLLKLGIDTSETRVGCFSNLRLAVPDTVLDRRGNQGFERKRRLILKDLPLFPTVACVRLAPLPPEPAARVCDTELFCSLPKRTASFRNIPGQRLCRRFARPAGCYIAALGNVTQADLGRTE